MTQISDVNLHNELVGQLHAAFTRLKIGSDISPQQRYALQEKVANYLKQAGRLQTYDTVKNSYERVFEQPCPITYSNESDEAVLILPLYMQKAPVV